MKINISFYWRKYDIYVFFFSNLDIGM